MLTGVYLRISRDDVFRARRAAARLAGHVVEADEVINSAIERQRQDCVELINDLAWDTHIEWYVDRDMSAYREDVTRPDFERLLQDLGNGRLDAFVVYHPDRLARQPWDAERLLKVVRHQSKPTSFATAEGAVDLLSERGEDLLRWAVMHAHSQSRATSRRVAHKHRELAQEGLPVGGHRPGGRKTRLRSIRMSRLQSGLPLTDWCTGRRSTTLPAPGTRRA